MKIIILLLALLSCSTDEGIKIKIQYPYEYYVFVYNKDLQGEGSVFISENYGNLEICEEKLIRFLGELNYLEITVYKSYEPYNGNLDVKLYSGENILVKNNASNKQRKTKIQYQF